VLDRQKSVCEAQRTPWSKWNLQPNSPARLSILLPHSAGFAMSVSIRKNAQFEETSLAKRIVDYAI